MDEHALLIVLHDEAKEFGVTGGSYDMETDSEDINVYPHTAIIKTGNSGITGFPIIRQAGLLEYASPSYKIENLYVNESDIEKLKTAQSTKKESQKKTHNESNYAESSKDDNLKEIHEATIDFLISLIQQDATKKALLDGSILSTLLTKEGKFKPSTFAKELCKDSNYYFANERGFSDETIRKVVKQIQSKYEK